MRACMYVNKAVKSAENHFLRRSLDGNITVILQLNVSRKRSGVCLDLTRLSVPRFPGPTMSSSEVQRPDDSPSTSGGSSDIEQRETVPPEQEREQAQPKKKETKISSKTAAKLSTSAKRWVKTSLDLSVESRINTGAVCSAEAPAPLSVPEGGGDVV